MSKKKQKPLCFDYPSLVDELGKLKAEISKLEDRCSEIKGALIFSNESLIKGELFQASVSHSERVTLDTSKVRAILSEEQIHECEKITPTTTVRVSSLTKG